MQAWHKQLLDAIPLRNSVRAFLPEPLDSDLPDKIARFPASLPIPFDHSTRLEAFVAQPGKKLYNNGINPANNIAIFAPSDLVSVSKAGFVGELAMLYAVSLGLSTCWFGHYKLAELGQYFPGIATPERIKESTMGYGYGKQIDVGERVICCMPFGHKNQDTRRLVDIVAGKNGAGRKPLSQLLENPSQLEGLPGDIKSALELALLAPSAANSQMWRFGFGSDYKTVTVAKPVGYKHFKWEHPDVDVGMCAAHLWLGLLEQGYSPRVTVAPDTDRALWTFTLSP